MQKEDTTQRQWQNSLAINNIDRLTVTYFEHGSGWSLTIPWRGSKLPQVKAQASLRTPKERPWSAVACYRLSLAKQASPTRPGLQTQEATGNTRICETALKPRT
jgi:hypothetical protein